MITRRALASAGRWNTGANVMLGGSDMPSIPHTALATQACVEAMRLDCAADFALSIARCRQAEALRGAAA